MNEDIKIKCQGCAVCIEFSPSKSSEKEMEEDTPSYSMEHMSTDLFTWNGGKYTLLMDWLLLLYSGYCFLKKFRREPNSRDVIDFLEEIFHEYEYPKKIKVRWGSSLQRRV